MGDSTGIDPKILEEIKREVSSWKRSLKNKGVYTHQDFIKIRNSVLESTLGRAHPLYDLYKSAISSYFGSLGGHAAASKRKKKKEIYSPREKAILRDLEKEELMEGAFEHQVFLVSRLGN